MGPVGASQSQQGGCQGGCPASVLVVHAELLPLAAPAPGGASSILPPSAEDDVGRWQGWLDRNCQEGA